MLHAYVKKFDVTDTVGNFLRTKQGSMPVLARMCQNITKKYGGIEAGHC